MPLQGTELVELVTFTPTEPDSTTLTTGPPELDISVVGQYTVKYTATDAAGNVSELDVIGA